MILNGEAKNMKAAALPLALRHKSCEDLIRLGSQSDGGYLVSKRDVDASGILLGFGINTDWNFEEEFLKCNPIKVRAYDASTKFEKFFKQAVYAGLRFRFGSAARKLFKYLSFRKFFSGKNEFYAKFVGTDPGPLFVSLGSIFEEIDEKNVFVKMDVEGSEYRCLDDLVSHQERLVGAVIEFHDVDFHLDRIVNFVKTFELSLVHVHANNFAGIDRNGVPLVVELTFSRHGEFSDSAVSLPHLLDRACNENDDEIRIEFR